MLTVVKNIVIAASKKHVADGSVSLTCIMVIVTNDRIWVF